MVSFENSTIEFDIKWRRHFDVRHWHNNKPKADPLAPLRQHELPAPLSVTLGVVSSVPMVMSEFPYADLGWCL